MDGAGSHRVARPLGPLVAETFQAEITAGVDIRPTIAVTKARLDLHEMQAAIASGQLKTDGKVVDANGSIAVVKAAIDPVWYLPGVAQRFGVTEGELAAHAFRADRRHVSRVGNASRVHVFLPPIGGMTL